MTPLTPYGDMKEVREPLRGKALVAAAVNHILQNPECHKQNQWHCGTKHCVGGWMQILGGRPETEGVIEDVIELTEMPAADVKWMCESDRTIGEIHAVASAFLEGEDFWAGFNRDGFDRAGFNRDGFDRAGFDRDGFDRDGFDRDGFDRAGFDRDGFDRAGFDRAGERLPLLTVEGE